MPSDHGPGRGVTWSVMQQLVGRVVGMVRNDGDNVRIELATAPAPEEVQEAVVLARG